MQDESTTSQAPPLIFICYAHRDNEDADFNKRCLDRLLVHLAPLEYEAEAIVWCDRALQIGNEWNSTILEKLQSARVAIALLSPAFFASEYIRKKEMPQILMQLDQGQTELLPIILSPCAVDTAKFRYCDRSGEEKVRSLNEFQWSNGMHQPLKGLAEHEQDEILLRVMKRAREIVTGKKAEAPGVGELGAETPNNLPRSTTETFVGREEALKEIDARLQAGQRVAVCAVRGMGGIGKTELVLRYAMGHRTSGKYPGAICWVNAREDVGIQIVLFARSHLGLTLPELPDLRSLVAWCWRQFPAQACLVVLDDVQDYREIEAFLPPEEARFKVLLTTRRRIEAETIEEITIEKLEPLAAYQLLYQTVKEEARFGKEQSVAEELCAWVGYLPLGIKLVGRFLKIEPDLSLQALLSELNEEKLENDALSEIDIVFGLSWEKLTAAERQLALLLGRFAATPIRWEWVEEAVEFCRVEAPVRRGLARLKFWEKSPEAPEQWCLLLEPKAVDRARRRLIELSLLERTGEQQYQVHPLLREFFAGKLVGQESIAIKAAVARVMIGIAKQIPQTPTLEIIAAVTEAIPHLQAVAEDLMKVKRRDECGISDDTDLIWVFVGIGRFYEGQGLYADAEPWLSAGLTVARSLLGETHPNVASSLNNLALLYESQGRYEDAELLYTQALELSRLLLGETHPNVATSLNNLALLYSSQGRYEDAEPLYTQALELRRSLLGEAHPLVAQSLNNLAGLYSSQGRYGRAEPLYIQALQISKQTLGEDHPDVAIWLNNLAGLYKSLERYAEAEPMYLQAMAIFSQRLGETHPYTQRTWRNFIEFLQQVIQREHEVEQSFRTSELSDHPMTRSLLQQLQNVSE